ncbi:MAG: twin-arginine translocation signal domain-containing protein [Actinomycetota bacterium]|nr:twin-arginine translocation signal domain-containing protein [Actinomycetota bacterium]
MNRLSRRELLKYAAVGAGTVAMSQFVNPFPAQAGARCLWGAYPDPFPGCETDPDGCGTEDYMPKVREFEALIGRTIGMTRHYPRWDYPVPNSVIRESRRTGHIPLISWRPELLSGQWLNWIDIANGVQDTRVDEVATKLANWNRSAYFVFHHEPENAFRHGHCGTQSEFALAYDHIRTRFELAGVTKLTFVCTLQRVTYDGSNGGAAKWFPDGAEIVGVDGYNRGFCSGDKTWKPFEPLFTTAHDFAVARGMNMMIEEWGCVENDLSDCGVSGVNDTKANWIRAAGDVIRSWPEVKAVIYTHSLAEFKTLPVDFRVNTSSEALAAYQEVGALPLFN